MLSAVLTTLKGIVFLLAGLVGFWLGWYYGAILGYWIWPNSLLWGALFSYFVGVPLGIFAALWVTEKMFKLAPRVFRSKHSAGLGGEQ
jgi:hypothetical protein